MLIKNLKMNFKDYFIYYFCRIEKIILIEGKILINNEISTTGNYKNE